jgi:hypothetical protein
MEQISNTKYCMDNLLPLLATKVGFFKTLDLSDDMYRKVLSAFPYIIRYKGSQKGIQLIVNLFERLTNTFVELDRDYETGDWVILFDNYGPHAELLQTLLEYVRPAGMFITYKVITRIKGKSDYTTNDKVSIRPVMKRTSTAPHTYPHGVVIQTLPKQPTSTNYDAENASTIGFTEIADQTQKE